MERESRRQLRDLFHRLDEVVKRSLRRFVLGLGFFGSIDKSISFNGEQVQLAIDDQPLGFRVKLDRLLADTANVGEIEVGRKRLQCGGKRILSVHQAVESILHRLLADAVRLIDCGIVSQESLTPAIPFGRHVTMIEPL